MWPAVLGVLRVGSCCSWYRAVVVCRWLLARLESSGRGYECWGTYRLPKGGAWLREGAGGSAAMRPRDGMSPSF